MNEIQLFNNPEFGDVRIIYINDIPYFIGRDICQVFGDTNHNRSLSRIDESDKMVIQITDSMGRKQNAIAINESGLFALLFAMQPQKANNGGVSDAYPIEIQRRIEKLHNFKHWVTSEVLPSIRKHGAYMTEPTLDKLLNDPDLIIGLATQLKEERAKVKAEKERNEQLTATNAQLDLENKQQAHEIDQLKPIAAYAQMILNTPGLLTTTQIAKDYGKSAVWLNRMLKGLGVQYQQNGQYLLYSKYAGNGYTHTKMVDFIRHDGVRDSRPFTMWTQKGRMFIYELLKKNGIVPMVEQT